MRRPADIKRQVFEIFPEPVFEELSALRFLNYRGTEHARVAVFECLKRGKMMNSGGFPLEDQLLLILVIENKKDKCIPAFVIQIG